MKQLSVLFVFFMLAFCEVHATDLTVNSISLKGNSNTNFGNYEIKELPPVNENGETMRAFELTYENAHQPVLIYLDERSNCKDYIVRSKNLEVRYACKKSSFGVQLLSGKQMKYDPALNALFLSEDEFQNQKKISEGGLPISDALELIANFYPGLLKSKDLLN